MQYRFKFGTHGFIFTQRNARRCRVTFLAEAMEAAAFTAVVKVGAHVYFVCGAPRIGTLQRFGSLVLVSVCDSLARTTLCIPVKLTDWHNGTCVLEERRQGLCFWNTWQGRKARGRPPSCFKVPWSSWTSFWLFPGLPVNPSNLLISQPA